MKRSRRLAALLFLALAAACGGDPSLQRFTPPEVDARSREYIGQFVHGQMDSVVNRLIVPLRTPKATAELRKIADILRNERFDTIRVIGAWTNTVNGVRHVNLTYELHSSFSWFVANVASVDTAGTWFVEGVSARTIAQPLELAAQFSLAGKSLLHYLWLVLTVSCAALSLGSAVFIATRRGMPRRWRWVLLSLLGVSAFRLNWATGAIDFGLLQVQLASASFLRAGPAAPWILSFAVPVGALVGLTRYRSWRLLALRASPIPTSAPQAAV
jgi:hypothetical protein